MTTELQAEAKATISTEERYQQFVKELTRLTITYGIAIKSIGGVMIADQEDDFAEVSYVADITSGDLYPEFPAD